MADAGAAQTLPHRVPRLWAGLRPGRAIRGTFGSQDSVEFKRWMAKTSWPLYLAASVVALTVAALPNLPSNLQRGPLAVPAVLGIITAGIVAATAGRIPLWAFYLASIQSIILISIGVYYGGDLGPAFTMVFCWPGAWSAYFYDRRSAIFILVIIAVADAVLLGLRGDSAPVARWLWTNSTVWVTSALGMFLSSEIGRRALSERDARREVEQAKSEVDRVNAELAQANKHKSEFLANMSHELRTPLNAIIGFSEVLQQRMFGDINERQEEYLGDILSSGRHLLDLINDILDLSKVEAGRMDLELTTFELAPLLEGAIGMMRERASRSGVTLALDVAEDVGPVNADERKIKQVTFNLLTNAVKFTPSGGRVDVIAETVPSGVQVSVRDTGVGISEEDQALIFEEFRQTRDSATQAQEGTGLGLALTKRFVELHGGSVSVTSHLGEGSTFSFVLPENRPAPAVPVSGDSPLVLVVEDDPTAAELMRIHLTSAGFRMVSAVNGEEGLRLARELQPAVIALDIVLPGLDGWEFLSRAKSEPELAAIPVIVLSMVDEAGKGFALGASEYMLKPVDRSALLATLSRLVPGPGRVLVIDDDERAFALVRSVLAPEGFEVAYAAGGREGIAAAAIDPPDLIILDLMMPDVDGFAVMDALRSSQATSLIPVVVWTAKTLNDEEKDRLRQNLTVLATKDHFDPEQFVQLVRASAPKEAS